MPSANRFRHQRYTDLPPISAPRYLRPHAPPAVDSHEFREGMQAAGARLCRAGVEQIWLAHGTFVGDDATGLMGYLAICFPELALSLERREKQLADRVTGENGNYTDAFVSRLEAALRQPDGTGPRVRRFIWSSENHHLARAEAALQLLLALAQERVAPDHRVLLWGHSHAGNVFALLSNLLAGDDASRGGFFHAAESFFRRPLSGTVDAPDWDVAQTLLAQRTAPLDPCALDMVTFGTPIRYGWDTAGYGRLMHFVNHRSIAGLPPYRAAMPEGLDDLRTARAGDYVQHLGIAGTNLPPNILGWRGFRADRRLGRFLEGDAVDGTLRERARRGQRVAADGEVLLVDYGLARGSLIEELAGHAVYTRSEWMLFHTEEVTRSFYEERPC